MDDEKILDISLNDLNVKYFKLMNGESIISYVRNDLNNLDDGAVVYLEEPMKVSMDHNNQYQLSSWLPFSSEIVHKLDVYNIVMEASIDDDIKAHYLKIILEDHDQREIPDPETKTRH